MTTTPSPAAESAPDSTVSAQENVRISPGVAFAAAWQFLTIAPPLVRRLFTEQELGASVAFFPVVGLLIGALLSIVAAALRWLLPAEVASVLLLAAWVVMTGGLHFDGFLDSCDGLFGGRTPEDRLRIMRDHRVGAFAVIGGVLLLLLKYAALGRLQQPTAALILACVLGRWLICLAILLFPYGRTAGLGRSMKDHAGPKHGVWATLIAVLAVVAIAPIWGTIAMIAAMIAGGITVRVTLKRLPGLTGDSYGAVCELGEAAVLVLWTAIERGLA
jgi:adenosylcobinamide-GDP ribazoletransferase